MRMPVETVWSKPAGCLLLALAAAGACNSGSNGLEDDIRAIEALNQHEQEWAELRPQVSLDHGPSLGNDAWVNASSIADSDGDARTCCAAKSSACG